MRIGFISTYPPIECGIATYTKYLSDSLMKLHNEVYIVSHQGGSGKNVFPAFDYEDPDLPDKAFSTMMRFTPDVVHIQHEFGLYGKHFGVSVIPLICKFKLTDIPVVTTLHTVYPQIKREHEIILQSIISHSNYIIVHEEYQKKAITDTFKKISTNHIKVIPHGARTIQPIQNAKKILGLPEDKKILLLIGYFRPSKNFELIIELMPEIIKKVPESILVVAGKIRGTEHADYRNKLFKLINNSPVREHIYLIRGQLPQETFDTILSAADLVALPYKITSQSGIMAHCLAMGKPMVVSGTDSMKDIIERSGAAVACNSNNDYINNIAKIFKDDDFANELSKNAVNYVKNNIAWDIIAKKHQELYSSIISIPPINTNIIFVD